MRTTVDRILEKFGLHLTRRPSLGGNTQILGSFPPYNELRTIGRRHNYFIHEGYEHRLAPQYYDDTTIGVDVAETCALLQKRYPDRQWGISDFSAAKTPKADLVIASDVIEHLADPDALLHFLHYIVRIAPCYVVISTPDRNLLRSGTHNNGPPFNPAHLRERAW
jgi:hypothetical protein